MEEQYACNINLASMAVRAETDRRLMDFMRLHKETMRRFFMNCGLFNGHPHVLMLIRQNEAITQRDLAERLGVAPATVAISIRRLESAGLVRRVRDEQDGRVFHVFLTEEGLRLDDRCRRGRDFMLNTLYQGLSEEEVCRLCDLIEKMTANLERVDPSFPLPDAEKTENE